MATLICRPYLIKLAEMPHIVRYGGACYRALTHLRFFYVCGISRKRGGKNQ